jgi:hypothetical protein
MLCLKFVSKPEIDFLLLKSSLVSEENLIDTFLAVKGGRTRENNKNGGAFKLLNYKQFVV